jgi:transcriptional regulator with XRE-family HTH domain
MQLPDKRRRHMKKKKLSLASTPLAKWLAWRMATWIDPETLVPGLSQNRLHELAGISQAQLHEILKQGHAPKPETLDLLARFFGLSPVTLYRIAYLGEQEPGLLDKLDRLDRILSSLPSNVAEVLLQQILEEVEREDNVGKVAYDPIRVPSAGGDGATVR